MQKLLDLFKTILKQNSFVIELAGIFDNIFNINGHIDFSKGLDFYSLLFWEKNFEYPKPIIENKIVSNLENVFNILRDTLQTKNYQLIKYGLVANETTIYLHINKDDQPFEVVLFMPADDDFTV